MSSLQRRVTPGSYPFTPSPAERVTVAKATDSCVRWLKVQGFEVLYMQKGLRLPRVIIRPSPLCDSLDGAVHRYERGMYGERRYWFAIRFDCEVRWVADVNAECRSGNAK